MIEANEKISRLHRRKYRQLRSAAIAFVLACCLTALGATAARAAKMAKGVELRQLTNDGTSIIQMNAASPGGNYVAFHRYVTEAKRELCVLDIESGQAITISDIGLPLEYAWSRDGEKLAYFFSKDSSNTSEISLHIWDAQTGKASRTAMRTTWKNYPKRLSWSPGNAALSLERSRDDYTSGVFVVPADGSAATEAAPNHHHNCFSEFRSMTWSHDGSRLAFISRDANDMGIVWTIGADGKNLTALTKPISCLWGLAWSWDGQRIAYNSGEGRREEERTAGMADIWVMHADGTNQRPITQGTAAAIENRTYWMILNWTRDNRYVIGWFGQPDAEFEGQERYHGFAFVDPETGAITEAYRNENGTSDFYHSGLAGWDAASDGKRVAFLGTTYTVRGPRGGSQTQEDQHSHLRVYSTETGEMENLITYRTDQDRVLLYGAPAWVSHDSQIVVTRRRVISEADSKYENDLFLVVLPQTEEATTPADGKPAPETDAKYSMGLVDIPILHRPAQEVAELLPDSYAGSYTVDEGRNCLVVPCNAAGLASLRECVATIDNVSAHIMINVLVVEHSKEAGKELGLDWEFNNSRFGGSLPFGDGSTPGSLFWQGVGVLDDTFFAKLAALEEKGEARINSNPRILAISGKEASITIRRTDFFLFISGYDSLGNPRMSRSDISADTILKMTPVLLGNGRISIEADATVDSFTFAGRDDLPDTTRRQAVTDVVCGNGESIVIGGLTQLNSSQSVHKTPVLGDLPLLGPLFRHSTRQMRESTLTIFITPHIADAKSPAAE